jgi:branched-subunit amino acid transport protein
VDAPVSPVWIVIVLVGAATVALKAVGPVVLGDRELPAPLSAVLFLLAPALLAALIVTQAVGGKREIVLDERLVGLGAAAVALLLRAPLLVVIVVAAAATAGVRALS